jgi:hypothetical protein
MDIPKEATEAVNRRWIDNERKLKDKNTNNDLKNTEN